MAVAQVEDEDLQTYFERSASTVVQLSERQVVWMSYTLLKSVTVSLLGRKQNMYDLV